MEEILASGMHFKIFNFLLFVGLLIFFLKKPVKEFWRNRSSGIRFALEEAKRMKEEAERRHDEIKARLSKVEKEMADLIRSLEEEGEIEKRKILEEAERLAIRIRKDGERTADQEIRRAGEILKAQAAQLSVELAEKLIRDTIRPEDQQRLTEKYLAGLERAVL